MRDSSYRVGFVVALIALALFASACQGSTEILAEPPPVLAEPTATPVPDATPTPLPAAEPTAVVAAYTVNDDWSVRELSAFAIGVPAGWQPITRPKDLETVLARIDANGEVFPSKLAKALAKLLDNDNTLVAIGPGGDYFTAVRSFGRASELLEHEAFAEAATETISGFAESVDFRSEPKRFGERPGVLVRGSYELEVEGDEGDELVDVPFYEFTTSGGAHLFTIAISLRNGDDPAFVTDLFRSLEIF